MPDSPADMPRALAESTSLPTGAGTRPPNRPRRNRTAALGSVAAIALVLTLLLGLGYAGLTPWSKELPGYRSNDATPAGPVSFYAARSAATQAAQGYPGGVWTPVTAVGFDPHSAYFLRWPGPNPYTANNSSWVGGSTPYPPPTACWWTPIGAANLTGFTVPGAARSVGTGLSPAWLFFFTDPSGGMLVVNVLDGMASPYASISGHNCSATFGPGAYQSIASTVIDSTQAVGVANAWGGDAFLANSTGVNETMIVVGAVSIPQYYYPPYSGVNGTGYPVVIIQRNYTLPATWLVGYTAAPYQNGTPIGGSFMTSLFASNGTMQYASAWLHPYGYPMGYYGTPPPFGPVGGGAMPLGMMGSGGASGGTMMPVAMVATAHRF